MATTIEVPPCQAACPIHTNVRGYVAAIAKGDAEEAIRIVRQVNPFPSVCGRIRTQTGFGRKNHRRNYRR